jgi:glycosyltransferase involved in cell wall biosynthesis
VEPGQVERYRKAMDVLLVPYQKSVLIQGRLDTAQWMSPLKVFEYMASRRPMVISDLPVLREVVNERNAIIVPPDDMDQWRQALVRLRDPALRQRVADAAYADFVAHHTWHQRAQSVLRGL